MAPENPFSPLDMQVGHLDEEIRANGWLQAPADNELLFGSDQKSKWEKSIAKIGINPVMLSGQAGHA